MGAAMEEVARGLMKLARELESDDSHEELDPASALCARAARLLRAPQQQAEPVSEERENAARWKAGESLAQFPEFCGHWEGRPGGQGWYHVATGERWYATAGEAMDAALKEKP